MSDNNTPINTAPSAIQRVKKRSMLKKQRTAVIFAVAATLLLLIAAFAVNYLIGIYVYPDFDGEQYYIKKINGEYQLCYANGDVVEKIGEYYVTKSGTELTVDPSTGKYEVKLVVDLEGTEEIQYNSNLLIFKQLTYDFYKTLDQSKVIKSIEVCNEYGSYTFERKEGNQFIIKGMEKVTFDTTSFARLAVSCGYTVTSVRLENPVMKDGKIDYAEYGLAPEKRTRVEVDEDGNEIKDENGNLIEIEYDYTPAWYVVTTMNGDVHKVYIGDLTVTGDGYYVKYEGRDRIYVLPADGLEDYAMQRVEAMLTPMIVSPTGQNSYFNVSDFIIYDTINYEGIYADLEAKYPEDSEEEVDEDEFNKAYAEILEKNSHKVCHFSYEDTTKRKGTIYTYRPYTSDPSFEYAKGYRLNSDNVDVVLAALADTAFTEVIKYNPTEEDFEKYELSEAPYMISFFYASNNSNGEIEYTENQVQISAKQKDGVFYAYSPFYNMIVGVKESSFSFLEWEELSWYDTNYIQLDIAHLEELIIESPEVNVSFRIDDSASRFLGYTPGQGKTFNIGETSYTVAKNDSKYALKAGDKELLPIYTGDYLVTPYTYTLPGNQSDGYLFAESKQADANGDGTNDCIIHYIYNLSGAPGSYSLYAIKRITDLNGNPLDQGENVKFTPQTVSNYFAISGSNYVYVTEKNSDLGRKIDAKYMDQSKYGKNGRGVWGSAYIYSSADGKSVLVDPQSGACLILDSSTCGIYFADSKSSRMAQRALTISEIKENGAIKRSEEIYYPLTDNDLYFDEESGLQTIDAKTGARSTATYADCTIGIWCSGSYYVTDDMSLIVVNSDGGEWGRLSHLSQESYVSEVYANGKLLDYVIQTTNHVGKLVKTTAMDNFKQFYGGVLYASFEGMADLSEEQKAEFRLHDDFSTGENGCQLKITVKASDAYGNRYDVVYRLYQYSERRSYITIEAISPENGFDSSSTNAYGNFFVLRSFADKIIEDAKRMVNAEEIDSATKY